MNEAIPLARLVSRLNPFPEWGVFGGRPYLSSHLGLPSRPSEQRLSRYQIRVLPEVLRSFSGHM